MDDRRSSFTDAEAQAFHRDIGPDDGFPGLAKRGHVHLARLEVKGWVITPPASLADRCAAVAKAIDEHSGTFPRVSDFGSSVERP